MDLTLESAFSVGGMVGHLSYLLLVASMLLRVMWALRVLVVASALVGISYDWIWLRDPVGVFWECLLIVVNIVQLAIIYFENKRSKFSSEEADFVDNSFPGLSLKLKRRLLDLGHWSNVAMGIEITRNGEPVKKLVYVASGSVDITSNGALVGKCESGSFVGKMTVLTGAPANGTATVAQPTRVWMIPAENLRDIVNTNAEIEQALKACFHRNVLEKLVRTNKLIEATVAAGA